MTPYFAPAWAYGGPPRSIYELSRELVRRGHSVTVLTTDAFDAESRADKSEEDLDGIRVKRCRNVANRLAWNQQLFLPVGTGRYLIDHLREYDIVHLHMYRTVQDIMVHRHASRVRVPYVFSARGSLPRIVRRQTSKALFDVTFGRRVLRDATRLVASSRAEGRQYEAMDAPEAKIAIVPNGIDPADYHDLPARGVFARRYGLEGRRLVTYVGRLNERKGLDVLLRAFQLLQRTRNDLALCLAGPDEAYQSELERLARQLGVAERVRFTGLVTGADRLGAFVDADVLVYPAVDEVFGRVPFEALLCGTPVVVSDDSGCGEMIAEAGAGLTFRSGDPTRLADAIAVSLEDRAKTAETVRLGRDFVLDALSWTRIGSSMERIYQEALVAPRGNPERPAMETQVGVAR